MRAQVFICTVLLLLWSATYQVRGARGIWRIYNTTDCSDEAHSLIGLALVESEMPDSPCSRVSGGSEQYSTFTPNLDGFDLQSFARAGSGWNIHMTFNTSNCGVFYDSLYIGRTGVCLDYVLNYAYRQSFLFSQCDQQNGSVFYNFPEFECDYYLYEQVAAPVAQCTAVTSDTLVTYTTTYCDGATVTPFNLTPFSISSAFNMHHALYTCWSSVVYVFVVVWLSDLNQT